MRNFIDSVFHVIELVIAVFLAVMIALMFMNVVLRYAFSKGFAWSEEIARICFIYLVYLGSIEAARDNRHLLIDSLLLKLKPVSQKVVYVMIQSCITYLMVLLTIGSWGLMRQNLKDRWVATGLPISLVYLAGFILGLSVVAISIVNIIQLVSSKKSVAELIEIPSDSNDDFTLSSE